MRNQVSIIAVFFFSLFGNPANAGIWKPLCAEHHECTAPYDESLGGGAGGYRPIDIHAAGALATQTGFIMQMSTPVLWRPNEQTGEWEYPGNDDAGWVSSDINTVTLSNGNTITFSLYGPTDDNGKHQGAQIRSANNQIVETVSWHGLNTLSLNNAALIAPTISNQDTIYVGMRGGGGSTVFHSTDGGSTWLRKSSSIRIGEDRFNLLPSPEHSALWAINSEFLGEPGSLWESTDHGGAWSQVDDGSFPANTVRVIHDPSNANTSYALTDHGLFASFNRGVTWEATTLTGAVHGLAIVERTAPLSRALIVGTDNGVKVSVTETDSWQSMSYGLPEMEYTVTYAHGVLMASSNAGHFICNAIDCAGQAFPLPAKTASGIVTVTEFYHSGLDHYFISASAAETQAIDNGAAGPGWVRTGYEFAAWNLLASKTTSNVCRFYGSQNPGPNSHFFSMSAAECSTLIDAQLYTPANYPRWNIEGYAFAAVPTIPSGYGNSRMCPKHTKPIYRLYNNGYIQGKDSNHRYISDWSLSQGMRIRGWEDEGIAFCVPG